MSRIMTTDVLYRSLVLVLHPAYKPFRKLAFTTICLEFALTIHTQMLSLTPIKAISLGDFYRSFGSGVSYTLHIRPICCHLDTARDGLSPSRIDKLSRFQTLLSFPFNDFDVV